MIFYIVKGTKIVIVMAAMTAVAMLVLVILVLLDWKYYYD